MTYEEIIPGAKIGKLTVIEAITDEATLLGGRLCGSVRCKCECGRTIERTKYLLVEREKELDKCAMCM
jgi:hypothetical protein